MSVESARENTTSPGTRRILTVASILVFLVGIQLFILTESTDRFFAWTIGSPLTAAFLGAAYWASFAMELAASRERQWHGARIAVPAVLLFTTLTFVVTVVHLEQFHLDVESVTTRFLTWGWIAVYAVVPPVMLMVLIRQMRSRGTDTPRTHRLTPWYRRLLITHAAVLVPIGIALLLAPHSAGRLWPWDLTPLTGRAVGAWLVGLGVAAAHAAWEDDWTRIRAATASYLAFGGLELVALARYPGEVEWSAAPAWLYVIFLISVVVAGAHGWQRARRIAGG